MKSKTERFPYSMMTKLSTYYGYVFKLNTKIIVPQAKTQLSACLQNLSDTRMRSEYMELRKTLSIAMRKVY